MSSCRSCYSPQRHVASLPVTIPCAVSKSRGKIRIEKPRVTRETFQSQDREACYNPSCLWNSISIVNSPQPRNTIPSIFTNNAVVLSVGQCFRTLAGVRIIAPSAKKNSPITKYTIVSMSTPNCKGECNYTVIMFISQDSRGCLFHEYVFTLLFI